MVVVKDGNNHKELYKDSRNRIPHNAVARFFCPYAIGRNPKIDFN